MDAGLTSNPEQENQIYPHPKWIILHPFEHVHWVVTELFEGPKVSEVWILDKDSENKSLIYLLGASSSDWTKYSHISYFVHEPTMW